jgi:hypothetical protein
MNPNPRIIGTQGRREHGDRKDWAQAQNTSSGSVLSVSLDKNQSGDRKAALVATWCKTITTAEAIAAGLTGQAYH